jgi:hypothetical protein
MCSGDKELFLSVLQPFLPQARATVLKLHQAFTRYKLVDMRREAHALKAASGYICATELSNAAGALEVLVNAQLEDAYELTPTGESRIGSIRGARKGRNKRGKAAAPAVVRVEVVVEGGGVEGASAPYSVGVEASDKVEVLVGRVRVLYEERARAHCRPQHCSIIYGFVTGVRTRRKSTHASAFDDGSAAEEEEGGTASTASTAAAIGSSGEEEGGGDSDNSGSDSDDGVGVFVPVSAPCLHRLKPYSHHAVELVMVDTDTTIALAAACSKIMRCYDVLVEHVRLKYDFYGEMLDDAHHILVPRVWAPPIAPTPPVPAPVQDGTQDGGPGRNRSSKRTDEATATHSSTATHSIPVSKPVGSVDCISRGGGAVCAIS